MIGVIQL